MTLPTKIDANHMIELAADHVDWFARVIKPLLKEWMEHGYKHGFADGLKSRIPFTPAAMPIFVGDKENECSG